MDTRAACSPIRLVQDVATPASETTARAGWQVPSGVDGVLTLALSTARQLVPSRMAITWTTAGCLFTLAASQMDILALSGGSRAIEIGLATAETFGCLLAIQCVMTVVQEDRLTEMGSVVDASAAGTGPRRVGRLLGSVATALLGAAGVALLAIAIYNRSAPEWQHHVVDSILHAAAWIMTEIALAGCWAMLAAILLPTAVALLMSVGAFVLGRLGDSWLPIALFPRPLPVAGDPDLAPLCAQALSAAGVLALALALRPRYDTD